MPKYQPPASASDEEADYSAYRRDPQADREPGRGSHPSRVEGRGADFLAHLGTLLLRLMLGAIFLVHGYMKIANLNQAMHMLSGFNVPMPELVAPGIALLEVIGGLALIFGFYARFFSLLLAINMMVAIVLAKAGKNFVGGWEFEALLIAALLTIVLAGPGALSLTHLHHRHFMYGLKRKYSEGI